jgi:hypothetical protein
MMTFTTLTHALRRTVPGWVALPLLVGCSSGGGMDTTADAGHREASLPPPPPDDGGVLGRSSIGWAVDYPDDVLTVISQHTRSFTHVAVLLYDISSYSGGVAAFWNTKGGADAFQNGLTSAQLAQKVHGMGLKMLGGIFGGQELGSNQGIVNILNDSPAGTQAGFITAMVGEAVAKSYDGYALDLAMGGAPTALAIDYAGSGAKMETFLGAFRAALHAHRMVLTLAFVPNDVKQSCSSYGNGVFDLLQLGRYVDLAMLEAYGTTLGAGSSSCPTSYTDPAACFPGSVFGPFANGVDLLCANTAQQAQMTVMMNASPNATNPFAGAAIALVEQYGIPSVSLFPQINKDGVASDGGPGYAIYDSTGISPAGTDWFTLLEGFMSRSSAP